MTELTSSILRALCAVPPGRVSTYGDVARAVGNPRAVRRVVFVLHSMSETHNIPWHRIINRQGRIAIKDPVGSFLQKGLLEAENIPVTDDGFVDLSRWGMTAEEIKIIINPVDKRESL